VKWRALSKGGNTGKKPLYVPGGRALTKRFGKRSWETRGRCSRGGEEKGKLGRKKGEGFCFRKKEKREKRGGIAGPQTKKVTLGGAFFSTVGKRKEKRVFVGADGGEKGPNKGGRPTSWGSRLIRKEMRSTSAMGKGVAKKKNAFSLAGTGKRCSKKKTSRRKRGWKKTSQKWNWEGERKKGAGTTIFLF